MSLRDLLWNLRSEITKTGFALFSGWLLHRLTTKNADLISYTSHVQTVQVPPQGQVPGGVIQTFSLFLWNQGKAPAKDVEVLHYYMPPHSVYPDLQRTQVQTPGGGTTIHFTSIAPKVLVTITYLLINAGNQQVISAVNYEHGPAQVIPVGLLRIFPKPYLLFLGILILIGFYTIIGWLLSTLAFLSHRT